MSESATNPTSRSAGGARALLFDFGGTLDAEGVPWKDRFWAIARKEGLDVSRAEFDSAFYGATDSLEGALPATTGFRETVERVTAGLAERLGGNALLPRIGERFTRESLEHLERSAETLSRLSAGYRIGVVSNFYGNLQAVLEETGLSRSVAVAVDSTLAGCKKPDARIFRAALGALGAAPSEAVFVGDSQRRDMTGAREMGMRHVWLRSAEAEGERCCPGDLVISGLSELLRLEL